VLRYLLILLVWLPILVFSQPWRSIVPRGNIWLFPDSIGIDFNQNPPQPVRSKVSWERLTTSTLADGLGNLIYYDRPTVYNSATVDLFNRQHQQILSGPPMQSQSQIPIVRVP